MNKDTCAVCGINLNNGCLTEVTVTVWRPAGMSLSGTESTNKICNKNACAVSLFDTLRTAAENKLNKTKTNAIGPVGPGSSGCTFNS